MSRSVGRDGSGLQYRVLYLLTSARTTPGRLAFGTENGRNLIAVDAKVDLEVSVVRAFGSLRARKPPTIERVIHLVIEAMLENGT